jgi:hypothetical protein
MDDKIRRKILQSRLAKSNTYLALLMKICKIMILIRCIFFGDIFYPYKVAGENLMTPLLMKKYGKEW